MRINTSRIERSVGIAAVLIVILAVVTFVSQEAVPSDLGLGETMLLAQAAGQNAPAGQAESQTAGEAPSDVVNADEAAKKLQKLVVQAEIRTYEIKMMARQLIRLTQWVIGILGVIAIVSMVSLWIGRQRAIPRSDLSAEITSTLVAVEERQAKLTNILKEIQQEIDYVHSMSVPDLKKLIEQAERYIEQNEKDLGRTAAARKEAGKGEAAKPSGASKPS